MMTPSLHNGCSSPSSRFPVYSSAGLTGASFKHQHFGAILADDPYDGFFEVHAENYMGAGGPPHRMLERIRQNHPVSLHGVCMSLGGPSRLDRAHLQRFRNLVDATSLRWFRSIWPGPHMEGPSSMTCCRCPTSMQHLTM